MTEEARKTILIVSAPQHENLCCITCYINPKEKHDPSAKSNYHWQILKCRQLIFSHKEIIASPVLGSEIEINIVLTKKFNETGKIQKQLQDLSLHENYPTQLTNAIYESCLRYTILAHMAPQWNQVDNCLIQGRDFLEATTALNAIRFDVEVKDMTTFIVLWPLKARLQQLQLEDLDIPPTLTQNFLTQPTAFLSTGSLWVHVIPSMKRGRIVSISRQIPNSCPYKTYKEIKRHWKNSYGYRLPESEEGMIYYTMSFHPNIPTKYTYPSICVRPRRTQFLGRVDNILVVKAFLTDLARKMPNVCGHPFSIGRQYCYEGLKSGAAASQLNGLIPIDAVFAKASSSLRSEQDVDIFATQHSNDVSLATPSLTTIHQDFSQQITLVTQKQATHKSSLKSSAISQATGIQTQSMNPSSLASTPRSAPLAPEQSAPAHCVGPPAIVPCAVPSKTAQPEASARTKFVPLFAPAPASRMPSASAPSLAVAAPKKYAPVFGLGTFTQVAPVRAQIPHPENSPLIQGASVPQKPIFGVMTGRPKITPSFNASQEKKGGDGNTAPMMCKKIATSFYASQGSNGKTTATTSKPKIAPSFNTTQETIGSGRTTALKDVARKRDASSSPQVASEELCAKKKARSKPQVKAGLDVVQLAQAHGLAKVNAVTLITWLRDQAVPCTTRDSKTDLVEKVNKYLNIQ